MDDSSEFDSLTERFNSLCDDNSVSEAIHKETEKIVATVSSVPISNYKKVGITAFCLYIVSFFITYYIIDPKYYQENGKTLKKQFMFCSICVFLFLIIYYYGFRYILKKYY